MFATDRKGPNSKAPGAHRRFVAVWVVLMLLGALLAQSAQASSSRQTAPAAAVCPQHPDAGYATCLALRRTDIAPRRAAAPALAAAPAGYAPADLGSAYNIPTGAGGGTVAIVDAYDDPNVESDLAAYRAQYGLPACTSANGCFRKVSQTGSTTNLPSPDTGWASEMALDTDMVSAACPSCQILLVEASSNSDADLGAAENYAASQSGVRAVSNSWGGGEQSGDPSLGNAYYNHPGIAIVAAAGDNGYGAEFPAASPFVTAVGGTALNRAGNARGWTESVWSASNTSGTGSGCSAYEAKPSWQTDTGCSRRTVGDVAAVADPATGVAVYDSYGSGGWAVYGGTSVGTPLIASMYALAGNPNPSAKYLYAAANASGLNDVTLGQNHSPCSSYLCQAVPGYDGPTGNGTPNGLLSLGGAGSSSGSSTFSLAVSPGSGSVQAGGGTSATVSTATTSGSPQTVTLTASGLPNGVSVAFNPPSVTSGGSSTMSVATTTAVAPGSYSLSVLGTGSGTTTAGTTYTLTVAAAACPTDQRLANPGFESGSGSWSATPDVIGQWAGTIGAPHSGSWSAWLDGYGTTHTDTLSQGVAVPSGCTRATVSFWLKINTSERTTTAANDTLTVMLGSTVLAKYSNLNHNNGYVLVTLTGSVTAGQNITLKFVGAENNSYQTSFVIDDTSLTFG